MACRRHPFVLVQVDEGEERRRRQRAWATSGTAAPRWTDRGWVENASGTTPVGKPVGRVSPIQNQGRCPIACVGVGVLYAVGRGVYTSSRYRRGGRK